VTTVVVNGVGSKLGLETKEKKLAAAAMVARRRRLGWVQGEEELR
jgi:hypothetical protein